MKDRIRIIRKNLNMNQTEFGALLGATQKMITSYESGRVIPDQTMRMLICQRFNVNPEWLETGEGKPYKEGLLPELVRALRHMPAAQAALERVLPRMSADDFAHLNSLIEKILRDE